MNIALLLKSELRRSAGILAGMALIIALALSIAVAAGICERMVKASAAQSADDFDLLIGARGSSSALLLGTVFLRDEMLPIVPASAWANIREAQTAKSSIRWAAPVAFGDRTPSGRTIVGTTRSFLDRGKSREPAAGRFFTKPTEAVAGASSGYVIGDKFSPMHGRVHGAGHAHEGIAYEVVGILPPTGTPWDRAVMVPIESVWAAHADAHGDHDHDHEAEEAHDREQPSAHLFESWMLSNKTHLEELPGFSAVIVKPASVSSAYRLRQRFNEIDAAGHDGKIVPLMGVFSAEVLVNLYAAFGGAGARLCMSAHEHRRARRGAFGERSARPPETANDFAAAHTGSSSPLCSSTHLVYCHDSGNCRHLGQSNPWMGCCRTLRRSPGTRNRSAHHAELFHARNLARIDGTCRRSGLRIAPGLAGRPHETQLAAEDCQQPKKESLKR